jgi:hypothetical protein
MYVPPAEYASTLHNVLVGLESSSLALWKLVGLAGGYLGLLLFTVYLASSEVRLPIVQYAKAPPPVSNAVAAACDFMETNGVWASRIVQHTTTLVPSQATQDVSSHRSAAVGTSTCNGHLELPVWVVPSSQKHKPILTSLQHLTARVADNLLTSCRPLHAASELSRTLLRRVPLVAAVRSCCLLRAACWTARQPLQARGGHTSPCCSTAQESW